MIFDHILILFKESTCQGRIQNLKKFPTTHRSYDFIQYEIERLTKDYDSHCRSLDKVEQVLKSLHISYKVVLRKEKCSYQPYDAVISIGGDGTFLDAAKNIKNQSLIGVNSSPEFSVGKFCLTDADRFKNAFTDIQQNKITPVDIYPLEGQIIGRNHKVKAINDFLIAHKNPAAITRYILEYDQIKEVQRSSGIWLASAAGSSGAINSAGIEQLPLQSESILYKPRELYAPNGHTYQLQGGALPLGQSMYVTSLVQDARLYIDGARLMHLLPYGTTFRVSRSKFPIKVFTNIS